MCVFRLGGVCHCVGVDCKEKLGDIPMLCSVFCFPQGSVELAEYILWEIKEFSVEQQKKQQINGNSRMDRSCM